MYSEVRGIVFNIQRFSIHDGPGIRTVVFLKGCPLRCRWCSNPESIRPIPELGLNAALCDGCGRCLSCCGERALSLDQNKKIALYRNRCSGCGNCVEVCYREALALYGARASVDDLVQEAVKDRIFYEDGGGVTASGGEPLHQFEFVTALFEACHREGVRTCLETSGYATKEALIAVLKHTDYLFFDLKHIDPVVHREYTGVNNNLILSNARIAACAGIPMTWRLPLIPGVNDTPQNVDATAQVLKALGNNSQIELLPFHRMGIGKYKAVDRPYLMGDIDPPDVEHVESVRQRFESRGVGVLTPY